MVKISSIVSIMSTLLLTFKYFVTYVISSCFYFWYDLIDSIQGLSLKILFSKNAYNFSMQSFLQNFFVSKEHICSDTAERTDWLSFCPFFTSLVKELEQKTGLSFRLVEG